MTAPRSRQDPRIVSIRYRAWCASQAVDGNLTREELAARLDIPEARLRRALRGQKWAAVLRTSALDMPELPEFQGAASFEDDAEARAFAGAVA